MRGGVLEGTCKPCLRIPSCRWLMRLMRSAIVERPTVDAGAHLHVQQVVSFRTSFMKKLVAATALVLFLVSTCVAAADISDADLKIGDLAPKLQTGKWLRGQALQGFDSNHVYIVEFWATWCGPCRASIPHLSSLSQRYNANGLIVIGQNVWDSDSAVELFVKGMGAKMDYRVTLDDKTTEQEGFMAEHWWKRQVHGHAIPMAFVIDRERRIVWMGDPMELREPMLDQILSGHFDLAKAAKDFDEQKQKHDTAERQEEDKMNQLNGALRAHEWDDATTALEDLLGMLPQEQRKNFHPEIRLQILFGQKKYQEAYKFAESFWEAAPEDCLRDNNFAWTILTMPDSQSRDVRLALKFAERAANGRGGRKPALLDTLARAQFMCGRTNDAVRTMELAVKLAQGEGRVECEKALVVYRQGKLP